MSSSSKSGPKSGLLSRLRGKKKEEIVAVSPVAQFSEATKVLSYELLSIKRGYRILETYPILEPFAAINIVEEEASRRLFYEVYEISLTPEEREIYRQIYEHMMWEMKPVASLSGDAINEIRITARRIMDLFQIRFPRTPSLSWSKINYYIERDFLGYGILDPIFRDRYIEDISCNGPGKPVYVWHRKYESLPTNVIFRSEIELDEYVLKLAHMAGKHISVAYPVLDAILPGGHRVAATFSKEVSTSGSSFTIRKFSESPITIADMINFGTISSDIAAYFWLAMDYKLTTLVLGVTGAGKSVSGSSRVLAVVNGVPGVYTLEEVWGKLGSGAREPVPGFQVVEDPDLLIRSCDAADLECKWVKPRFIIRHRNDKKMLRVRLRSGRYVDVTEDHSLIVFDEDGAEVVKPSKEVVGKHVAVPLLNMGGRPLSLAKALRSIDGKHVYVNLPENPEELMKESAGEDGVKIGKLTSPAGPESDSPLKTRGKIRLDEFLTLASQLGLDISKILNNIELCGRAGACAGLKKIASKELAEIMGLYLAGGRHDGHAVTITCSNYEYVKKLCRNLNTECTTLFSGGRTPAVVVGGWVEALIRASGMGEEGREKRLPRLYWVMPEEWRAAFLRGYIKGNGYLDVKKLSVETTAGNEALAWDLLYAFSDLGILATLSSKRVEGTTYYRVRIPSNYIGRLADLGVVSFSEVEGGVGRHNWGVYDSILPEPPQTAGDRLRHPINMHSGSGLEILELSTYVKDPAGGEALHRLEREASVEDALEALGRTLATHLAFDEIELIEEIEPETYVYDFEVPGTESFEAGNIIVHNTSTLNAMATLLRPTYKVVTIEDTPELKLPLENWVQLVSRPSYLGSAGEVSLYQLVRVSLRYRPDIIIVGEVRGDEAYVLFQSIATGHSGITTLHAESIDAAVKRLTSPPMNIPPSYIPLVNVALLIRRVTLVDERGRPRPARKITNVWEIKDVGEYDEIARWDPAKNRFSINLENSTVLKRVSELTGKTRDELMEELVRRKMLLEWLVATRKTAYRDVATWIQRYYIDPVRTLREGPLYGSAT